MAKKWALFLAVVGQSRGSAKKWPVFLAVVGQSRGSAKKWALFLANAIYTDKEGGFLKKPPSFLHHAPSLTIQFIMRLTDLSISYVLWVAYKQVTGQ